MQGRNGKGCKESRIITYPAIPNTKDRADMELEQQAFETPYQLTINVDIHVQHNNSPFLSIT